MAGTRPRSTARIRGWLSRLPSQLRARRRLGSCGRRAVLGCPLAVTGGRAVTLGDGASIARGARLDALGPGAIHIGAHTTIEFGVHIGAAYGVSIGDRCLIAGNVTIIDHDHTMAPPGDGRILDQPLVGAPVVIGRSVWIGEKATVLKGVSVGDYAIVGAHAVVTQDVPARSIVGGVPARVIGRLDDQNRIIR